MIVTVQDWLVEWVYYLRYSVRYLLKRDGEVMAALDKVNADFDTLTKTVEDKLAAKDTQITELTTQVTTLQQQIADMNANLATPEDVQALDDKINAETAKLNS